MWVNGRNSCITVKMHHQCIRIQCDKGPVVECIGAYTVATLRQSSRIEIWPLNSSGSSDSINFNWKYATLSSAMVREVAVSSSSSTLRSNWWHFRRYLIQIIGVAMEVTAWRMWHMPFLYNLLLLPSLLPLLIYSLSIHFYSTYCIILHFSFTFASLFYLNLLHFRFNDFILLQCSINDSERVDSGQFTRAQSAEVNRPPKVNSTSNTHWTLNIIVYWNYELFSKSGQNNNIQQQ